MSEGFASHGTDEHLEEFHVSVEQIADLEISGAEAKRSAH